MTVPERSILNRTLVLASASPRRAELLAAAGFTFEARGVDIDETPRANEPPDRYVRRLAAEKSAASAARRTNGAVILAADTTVVIDGTILGKPADDDEARSMLRRLAGRTHQVLTGVSIRDAAREVGCVESTDVVFAPLSRDDIEWYVATGEGRDKAGAYAIQGLASRFIPRIAGSYTNVVGLPVAAVFDLLKELAE